MTHPNRTLHTPIFIGPSKLFKFATVVVCSISGLTSLTAHHSPLEVFAFLERFAIVMDHCVSLFPQHLYTIERYLRAALVYSLSYELSILLS